MTHTTTDTPGYCRCCLQPLPDNSRPNRQFCSRRCRDRASKRRAAGQPEADPTIPTQQLQDLQEQADRLARENARLRKLVTRIHATRQKWQTKALSADDRIAAERRRTEQTEVAAAGRAAAAKQREAEARVGLVRYRQRVMSLEHELSARKKAEEDRDIATDVARKIGRNLDVERKRAARVRRHFQVLAGRYFRTHQPETWDEFDQDIYDTYRQIRQAAQQQPQHRRTR